MSRLTLSQRTADATTAFCGSWWFIFVFSALSIIWVAGNTLWLVFRFDPYPYILFNLVLTIVSTFQGPLIMMSQNRQREIEWEDVRMILIRLDEIRSVLGIQ